MYTRTYTWMLMVSLKIITKDGNNSIVHPLLSRSIKGYVHTTDLSIKSSKSLVHINAVTTPET